MPDERLARALRGFGPVGLFAIALILAGNVLFLPLSALLLLGWARLSETPWHALGFVRPRSWITSVAAGIALGAFFKLAMKAIVMPLLGAPPGNARYHFLAGNTAALAAVLYAVIIGAGFGEETVFRGWMFERLGKLFGASRAAKAAIVVITTTLFAAAHYADQGVPGVEQAAFTGLVFGGIFAVTGELFTIMIAHAAFDVVAVALIYWDIEAKVAHLLIK